MTRLPQYPTRRALESPANLCRLNGWGPGTELTDDADDGQHATTIEITAMGTHRILVRVLRRRGVRQASSVEEETFSLYDAQWREKRSYQRAEERAA